MNDLFTVIGFTFKNKFKSKAFLVSSIILIVILSVAINLPYIIQQFSSDEPTQIGVLHTSSPVPGMMEQYYASQENPDISIIMLNDEGSPQENEKAAKQKVADGDIDGYLVFTPDEQAGFPKVAYKSEGSLEFSMTSKLQTALQFIKTQLVVKDLGLTDAQLAKLKAPVSIEPVQISVGEDQGAGKSESQMVLAYGLVYVLIILFFMGVMISGQLIATEITSEKSSRVMEILITSVAPLKQMFGKIIGMLLLALTQIAVFVVVAILNLSLPQNVDMVKQFHINFADIDPTLIVYFVIFYFLGFFLFATLFAAVGSLVSRTEDLGQAILPITFLSLAAFYVGIFGINAPTSSVVTVTSFIPFFSPIVMFLRIGMASPALWEILLSIGILLVSIFIIGWLSAKIYRTGVLMYGKRPTFKELRKAMKAFKV